MTHEDLQNLTFEAALQKLEQIVKELEAGQIRLDDAVEAYEKAMVYKNFCEEKLQAATLKIEKIQHAQTGEVGLTSLDEEVVND